MPIVAKIVIKRLIGSRVQGPALYRYGVPFGSTIRFTLCVCVCVCVDGLDPCYPLPTVTLLSTFTLTTLNKLTQRYNITFIFMMYIKHRRAYSVVAVVVGSTRRARVCLLSSLTI
jgi:hypothetical protein